MIKVEHTKTHKTPGNLDNPGWLDVLVTDAELVLVYNPDKFDSSWNYKPILISRTEKIEVDDWCYSETFGLFQASNVAKDNGSVLYTGNDNNLWLLRGYVSKVLSFFEYFSPQQLQMIVDGKLKDGDKVLVECENIYDAPPSYIHSNRGEFINVIKLNPHITIYPTVEETMYPISVVKDAFQAGLDLESHNWHMVEFHTNSCKCVAPTYNDFNQWFEQNVK